MNLVVGEPLRDLMVHEQSVDNVVDERSMYLVVGWRSVNLVVQGCSRNVVRSDVSRNLNSRVSLVAYFSIQLKGITTLIHWSHQEAPLVFQTARNSVVLVQCNNMSITSFEYLMSWPCHEFPVGSHIDQVKGHVRPRSNDLHVVGIWNHACPGYHLLIMSA